MDYYSTLQDPTLRTWIYSYFGVAPFNNLVTDYMDSRAGWKFDPTKAVLRRHPTNSPQDPTNVETVRFTPQNLHNIDVDLILTVLGGNGELLTNQGGKLDPTQLSPGTRLRLPARKKHAYRPDRRENGESGTLHVAMQFIPRTPKVDKFHTPFNQIREWEGHYPLVAH